MHALHQPHFPDDVIVFVQREAVDADGDAATACMRGRDRREAGAQMHVGAEIGDDARAGSGDHLEFVRPGVDAVRQCQPFRQKTDIAEVSDDALRIILVRPGALVDGLQQVHVNAAAGSRRIFGNRFQQRF